MLPLLLTWVITMKTVAQSVFGEAPDNPRSHSALLNIHHPGGSRLHSYHRHGPYGNGVLYVHRQGTPVPSPLLIHRISLPHNQHSKLSYQTPRATEGVEKSANRNVYASIPIDSPDSGRAEDLSSVLLAPTGYFNTEEINGISDKMPVETIVYPLAKTIQKYYVPRKQPFYVRLPPEYPLHHIPVAMVVTPPVAPQYFRSSNWYPPKDGIHLEESTPSLTTPRPLSLPPRPSLSLPAASLPPFYFPTDNYYSFIPPKNKTDDDQAPVSALHPPPPLHFPYNNSYTPSPESDEQTSSEPLSPIYSSSRKYESYDPPKLQMQQNDARSKENVDSSARSPEQPPSYYFLNSGYNPYDPSHVKGEARTLPHHHASYHETISHTPLLIHGGHTEGVHKHIMIHHSEPTPYVHSDLAPTLYDDIYLDHGGHSTYLHKEPSLHGHISLNLGRNAPLYVVSNKPHTYDDGFHQPLLSTVSHPEPVSYSIPYSYRNPSYVDYSSIPHIVKQSIPIYNRNIRNDVQQTKPPDVPYLLRHLRSFEGSEHKSTSNLDNLASESDKSLTISLPIDISNTAEDEIAIQPQKKEAISEDENQDFHPETAKLLDLSQVLNTNEVRKRLILEKILSRKVSSEEEDTHKTVLQVGSHNKSFSQDFSESSASHEAEIGDEAHVKQLHQEMTAGSFAELRDVSLQPVHHEPEKATASLDTLWQKMRAKRSKRQTSQKQNNNTSPDSNSRTSAHTRSQKEERTIGYVIGFLDPESYNYYFGSENNQNFASDQNYYHLNDYKKVAYDKTGHFPIPVYYRQRKTDSYIPVDLMSYKETATSDPRSIKEEFTNSNITTKNADGYWSYNKTARYNSFGGDSFSGSYDPYAIQHNLHNPKLVTVPHQHLMPHHFLNIYPAKMYQLNGYPVYPYSSDKLHNSPTRYQQTSGYYADRSDYPEEPQMSTRSFGNMGPENEHPIRHHHYPNRYNTHMLGISQANVRPHDANVHPIVQHQRPGRYYEIIPQEPELDTRPYYNFNGANVYPIQPHRPSRYYARLHGYPHETHRDARSFHNIEDTEESPVRQHYTSRYYEHASGYPPRDTRLYDYNDIGYYFPSRYFDPALATPYGDTELVGPHHLRRYYEYPYQPNGDITSYQVDSIHQHPIRYHHLRRYHERIHGHSYQPAYHMERFHPSRYHHSHRYQEHVHGNAYRSHEEATPDSNTSETNRHPQVRSDEEETNEYPQKMHSGINPVALTELPPGSNYPSKYYASGNPESQIALVSFFTTDKQSPYPIRFHRLDPYGLTYHPSQYMNPNWEGGYNTAGYFSKMAT